MFLSIFIEFKHWFVAGNLSDDLGHFVCYYVFTALCDFLLQAAGYMSLCSFFSQLCLSLYVSIYLSSCCYLLLHLSIVLSIILSFSLSLSLLVWLFELTQGVVCVVGGELQASCGPPDEAACEDMDWEEEREMERLACEGDDFIPPKVMVGTHTHTHTSAQEISTVFLVHSSLTHTDSRLSSSL